MYNTKLATCDCDTRMEAMDTENKINETDESAQPDSQREPVEINYDLLKSRLFRVIHVDGAYGGLNPSLSIHMAIYSERTSIPTSMTHEVDPKTGIGKELADKRVTRKALIREVEASLIMDIPTAQAMIDWLQDKVKQAQEVIKVAERMRQER
jgi:hypothetical protein